MNSFAVFLSFFFLFSTDFSNTQTVVVPDENQEKVVYAQKPAKPNPAFQALGSGVGGVGKGLETIAQETGKGAGWFFGELLRPIEAIRTGLIDAFGVKEESGRKKRK